jgi:hypothetical protein
MSDLKTLKVLAKKQNAPVYALVKITNSSVEFMEIEQNSIKPRKQDSTEPIK